MRVWRRTTRRSRPPRRIRQRNGIFLLSPAKKSRPNYPASHSAVPSSISFRAIPLPVEPPSAPPDDPRPPQKSKQVPKPRINSDPRRRLVISLLIGIGLNVLIGLTLLLIKQAEINFDPPEMLVAVAKPDKPSERDPYQKSYSKMASTSSSASAADLNSSDHSLHTISVNALSSFNVPDIAGHGGANETGFLSGTEIGFGEITDLNGSGYGDVISVLEKSGLGNGEGLIVIRDISGSMKIHIKAVDKILKKRYPKATLFPVQGCKIKLNAPFLTLTQRIAQSKINKRRTIFFICDMKDQQGVDGVDALKNSLFSSDPPFRLHIISFSKSPHEELAYLIEISGGTLTLLEVN